MQTICFYEEEMTKQVKRCERHKLTYRIKPFSWILDTQDNKAMAFEQILFNILLILEQILFSQPIQDIGNLPKKTK